MQSSQEYTSDNLFAYDISITDRNGEEFQPVSDDPIKVEITNSAIIEAQQANQNLRMWHIDDNGLREEITDFKLENDKIIFEASGFSVYEVDNGKSALRTYKFLMPGNPQDNSNYTAYYYPTNSQNSDGSYKEICSQTIKNGENLIFPQLPADMGSKYTFVGWFIGSGGTPSDHQLDFNNIPPVTQNETVELYAVFESCVYAIFHEQYNGRTDTFPVFATRRGRLVYDDETSQLKATFTFDDLKVIYDDEEKKEGARLILHACWKAPIRIPVYYVDTSNQEWVRKDEWRKAGDGANIVLRDSSPVSLADKANADIYAKDNMTEGYEYVFATESGKNDNDYETITDNVNITEIWYDSDEMCVKAKYRDNTIHEFDAANDALYLVYYKSPDSIPVGYDLMAINGSLTPVSSVNASAPQTAVRCCSGTG